MTDKVVYTSDAWLQEDSRDTRIGRWSTEDTSHNETAGHDGCGPLGLYTARCDCGARCRIQFVVALSGPVRCHRAGGRRPGRTVMIRHPPSAANDPNFLSSIEPPLGLSE